MDAVLPSKKFPDYISIFFATLMTYTIGQVVNAVFIILGLFCAIFNMKKAILVLVKVWANILFLMIGQKVNITGKENIVDKKGYIVLINHGSFLDIPALMLVKPDIAWVGKESYSKIPVFGKLISMLGYIPIRLDDPEKIMDSFLGAIEAANKNTSIGFFPEGTRTLDGRIRKFKKGFIYLLRNCDLDILPITFNGFYTLKPKNSFFLNPNVKLEIIIHKPVDNRTLRAKTDSDILSEMRQLIERDYSFRPA
jgi:1-acyl-sn-glycerol-3-phosphate acyltransferase